MDLSGLTSAYSRYADALDLKNSSATGKLSSLQQKDLKNASDDELMEVCKEFEAYFMEMVMKEMVKTVDQDEESNALVDYFADSAITDLAKQASEQSEMGLAQQLYEQMKRNYSI